MKGRLFLAIVGLGLVGLVAANGQAQDDLPPLSETDPGEWARSDEPLPTVSIPSVKEPTVKRPMQTGFGADGDDTEPEQDRPGVVPVREPSPQPTATPQPVTSPTAGPSPTPLRPLSKAVENLRWEASLAENSYGLDRSESSALALIAAYERLLGPLCMPDIHRTLEYAGSPTDPRCLEAIDKIVAIDAENPLVLCARDGIDAKSCRSAFASQRVESFVPGYSNPLSNANLQGVAGLNEKLTVSTLDSKLQPIMNRIRMFEQRARSGVKLSPEEMTQVVKSFEEALSLTCRLNRIEVVGGLSRSGNKPGSSPPRATPTPPPLFPALAGGTRRKSPFDDVLEQFGGGSSSSSNDINPLGPVRIRKITDRCKDLVTRALALDRTMALPVCYRDGFYSPSCIDARRKERTSSQPKPSGTNGPAPKLNEGGFSAF